ncbi:MAG: hypothetical protein GXP46_06120 [Deferribacteres bacterium]|nr:hypothetical protein [Deferribacteres bacterium]
MNKRLFIGLIVFLLSVGLVATSAFARGGNTTNAIPITVIYTVGSSGSTVEKTTFSWTEVPWLYFELPAGAGTRNIVTQSWWNDPNNIQRGYITQNEADNTIKVWQSLGSTKWNSIKKQGQWTILAQYDTTSSKTTGQGKTSFIVNGPPPPPPPVIPEPVSSVLFLVGGTILGIRYWKRKISS